MNLKQQILLCFSEEDNQPIEGVMKGWVSNFHKFLTTLLYQISRDQPEVVLVSESNLSAFRSMDALVVVVISSPALVRNTALVEAINNYGNRLAEAQALTVDGIPRIFKVHKAPFDEDEYFPEFRSIIPYDFYMIDALTGDALEFKRFFGTEAERSYWMKLVDMAYDIHHIQAQGGVSALNAEDDIPREKTVYLASTGVDMVIQRDIIKRELIRHGYKVLPQHTLPKEVHGLEQMVREDLHKCRLSIHIIGEDYGYKPKGSDLSIVDIQNRLASDHTYEMADFNKKNDNRKPFSRLIWVSPDLKNVTERQKIFIEDLKSDAAALEEAEVLQITLQEFKSIIREELVTGGRFNLVQREVKGFDQSHDGESKIIYLIHDKPDREESIPIQRYLENSGYKVVAPSFEGDLVDIRYVHQENLRRCDASIIFFGKAKESWIKTKLQDLLKAPGFGRDKKLQAKAVYFVGKKEVDLEPYKQQNALILGNNGGFKPEHLAPFLTKLEK